MVARQPQEGRLIRPGRGGSQGPSFGFYPAKSGGLPTSYPEGCRAASESDRNAPGGSRVSPPRTFLAAPLPNSVPATEGEGHAVSPHRFRGLYQRREIVALSPRCDDGSEAFAGWIATCTGGEAVELAAYYVEPGRLEQAIRLMPAVDIRLADHSAT